MVNVVMMMMVVVMMMVMVMMMVAVMMMMMMVVVVMVDVRDELAVVSNISEVNQYNCIERHALLG